jgi:hypothetical protein
MSFPIEEKLVIGVASSALFQLDEADEIFRKDGIAAYRTYQREHQKDVLRKGIAFPFIRRLLKFNELFPEAKPVEVVLLSHNDPDTGARVFHSIRHYGLEITRAAFTTGVSPYAFIPAYNVSLFLSANGDDVKAASAEGFAAGQVLDSAAEDKRREALMASLDRINARIGRGAVRWGAQEPEHAPWHMQQEHLSPKVTTDWSELACARCSDEPQNTAERSSETKI